jgi:hypothetical protein
MSDGFHGPLEPLKRSMFLSELPGETWALLSNKYGFNAIIRIFLVVYDTVKLWS